MLSRPEQGMVAVNTIRASEEFLCTLIVRLIYDKNLRLQGICLKGIGKKGRFRREVFRSAGLPKFQSPKIQEFLITYIVTAASFVPL